MENVEWFYALAGALGGLAQVILIVASILLVYKNRHTGTVLMLMGSILMLLNSVGSVIFPIIFSSQGPEFLVKSLGVRQIAGQFPFLIYVLGALIYAIQLRKKSQ